MEISELVDRFPRVDHVTTGGAWDGIAATGLLSTSALLDRFEVREGVVEQVVRIESDGTQHRLV